VFLPPQLTMSIAITVRMEPPPGATHYAAGSGRGPSTIAWYRVELGGPTGEIWKYWSEDHRVWWFYGYDRKPNAMEIRNPNSIVPTVARGANGEDLVRRSDHEAALGAVAQEAAELRQRVADILADTRAV
jgi:hypothetical protein